LHRVFHGIRFKVNERLVVVRQPSFFMPSDMQASHNKRHETYLCPTALSMKSTI
jgi:hypothetical protein